MGIMKYESFTADPFLRWSGALDASHMPRVDPTHRSRDLGAQLAKQDLE
jgi:hypothetical protein